MSTRPGQLQSFPATIQLEIPDEFVGTFNVAAIAKLTSGNISQSPELNFTVIPASTLNKISVEPNAVQLEMAGEYQLLRVIGHYADGIDRDISAAATGTSYATADALIATVNSDGKVTAEGDGQTSITVQNTGLTVIVPVDVDASRFLR